jgi:2-oxoisovalerate dehydrogenase E2 component (dihydrolipoyl transacylase)
MVRSAFTAPHVTEWVSVDVTRSLKLIKELRAAPATRDLRITLLTLAAWAAVITLARHGEINASWDEESSEIVRHRDINLGIAVASPRGLIVPNIPAAQTLDFIALSRALTDLIGDARANRTTVDAMRQGTFTITNVGIFGVDGATPILNPGESGILALGQTRKLPWNHKNRIRLRSVSTLSLSFDHRLVDDELGSGVLTEIARLLERPSHALVIAGAGPYALR